MVLLDKQDASAGVGEVRMIESLGAHTDAASDDPGAARMVGCRQVPHDAGIRTRWLRSRDTASASLLVHE